MKVPKVKVWPFATLAGEAAVKAGVNSIKLSEPGKAGRTENARLGTGFANVTEP